MSHWMRDSITQQQGWNQATMLNLMSEFIAERDLNDLFHEWLENVAANENAEAENVANPALIDVHTEHCCQKHGCKYGKDETCSVVQRLGSQNSQCEICQPLR